MKRSLFALIALAMLSSAVARAGEPTTLPATAPEVAPSRFALGVNPLGPAVLFGNNGFKLPLYWMGVNFGVRVLSRPKMSLWLGAELNLGGEPVPEDGAQALVIEPGLFAKLSFDRVLRIPLVPYFKVGVAGGTYDQHGSPYAFAAWGGVVAKVGGGFQYFVTRHVGIGAETNLGLGAVIPPPGFGGTTSAGFIGTWDLQTTLVFAF
jgi:hypothetical protein